MRWWPEGRVEPRSATISSAPIAILRTLEHRLQMIEDEQTHSMPQSDDGIAHIACFMGYDDAVSLSRRADRRCWRTCRAIMPGCSNASRS